MSGSIGLVATDLGRYTLFMKCMIYMRAPANTDIQWCLGTDFANNRNKLAAQALERGSEWILYLDDDHAFGEDHLMRLLSHEQPIVASLYTGRARPFKPIAYDWVSDDEGWTPIELQGRGEGDLVEVDGVGTGGMLIRSEVFHKMPEPWFEKTKVGSEDLEFCKKARALGFPVYVDLGAPMAHMTTASVAPSFVDGEWTTRITLADGSGFTLTRDEVGG
jgi:GT2 family glycosyltransferase